MIRNDLFTNFSKDVHNFFLIPITLTYKLPYFSNNPFWITFETYIRNCKKVNFKFQVLGSSDWAAVSRFHVAAGHGVSCRLDGLKRVTNMSDFFFNLLQIFSWVNALFATSKISLDGKLITNFMIFWSLCFF